MNFLASESARVLRGLAGLLEPARQPTAPAQHQVREFRIDDLAREAGMSVRNVRVYQDRGLLPPPRREGRTGWYNESHLARLDLIGRMLDRGYTFATISELLTAAQYGMRVEEVLDTDRLDTSRPSYTQDATLTLEELREVFGSEQFEQNVQRALKAGLVREESGNRYRIANERLLEAARLLFDAGVPMAEIIDQAGAVRRDLVDIANRFVKLVTDRYLPADGRPVALDEFAVNEIAELVTKARATVHDVVNSLLLDAMEEAIAQGLEDAASRMFAGDDDQVFASGKRGNSNNTEEISC
ncbi:MerR family transcriptional regulator [Skermania sp. ID1734]|nr:MerR family transcriptional regulator [Skermania sp. ID1734]